MYEIDYPRIQPSVRIQPYLAFIAHLNNAVAWINWHEREVMMLPMGERPNVNPHQWFRAFETEEHFE